MTPEIVVSHLEDLEASVRLSLTMKHLANAEKTLDKMNDYMSDVKHILGKDLWVRHRKAYYRLSSDIKRHKIIGNSIAIGTPPSPRSWISDEAKPSQDAEFWGKSLSQSINDMLTGGFPKGELSMIMACKPGHGKTSIMQRMICDNASFNKDRGEFSDKTGPFATQPEKGEGMYVKFVIKSGHSEPVDVIIDVDAITSLATRVTEDNYIATLSCGSEYTLTSEQGYKLKQLISRHSEVIDIGNC